MPRPSHLGRKDIQMVRETLDAYADSLVVTSATTPDGDPEAERKADRLDELIACLDRSGPLIPNPNRP